MSFLTFLKMWRKDAIIWPGYIVSNLLPLESTEFSFVFIYFSFREEGIRMLRTNYTLRYYDKGILPQLVQYERYNLS